MPRGRARAYSRCRTIAAEVIDGHTYPAIAERYGLSRQVVAKRVNTIRLWLAETTGDGTWIDKKAHTAVQAARAYIELDGPDGEPES